MSEKDRQFMLRAIELAHLAEREGNLPVGAVITLKGQVVSEGRSAIWFPKFDVTRHAEMEALRAVPAGLWQSAGTMNLYTTLEPCLMCCGAILLYGIGRVVFGASDDYGGARASFDHLSPFFKEQLACTNWIGPLSPRECDPLHRRLLEIEGNRGARSKGLGT